MAQLEIRLTVDGKLQARRKDGLPLNVEDREEAKKLIEQVCLPPRAWIVEEVRGDETLRAVKICSEIVDDHLWLIIDRSFEPHDGLAIYYAEELPSLKNKTPEDLRAIHKVKLAFPGSRIIQDEEGCRV